MSGGCQELVSDLLLCTFLAVQNPLQNSDLSSLRWNPELCHLCGTFQWPELTTVQNPPNVCTIIVPEISPGKVGGGGQQEGAGNCKFLESLGEKKKKVFFGGTPLVFSF